MISVLRQPKILGACIIGGGLVAATYVVTNFGQTTIQPSTGMYAIANEPPARIYIEPTDTDGDGIQDWQADFVNKTPIVQQATGAAENAPFTPETLTEQISVQFFETVIRARETGDIGLNEEQIVSQTVERLKNSVNDTIYNTRDITIIPTSQAAIYTYGNTMGGILINNNVANNEGELTILQRAMQAEDPTILAELQPLAAMYKNMRDQSLNTPVPDAFKKEHLDLVNVYHALYMNITGMEQAITDPTTALLRIKRYQDDATGLALSLRNMYNALIPYANLYTVEDPVTAFLPFGPVNNQ